MGEAYTKTSCFGTTADPKAATCFGATSGSSGPGPAQTLWETTVTLQYKPFPDLITRAEFRYDKSNQLVFQDRDKADNNQETIAIEAIYLF
ncbi:MAG: outer membrane beta-barrel protein [Nitrospirales bacterium]|nr:outer membrane beta-barrel protein [Nitrospirales bacterium]